MYMNDFMYYILFGVVFNAIYDLSISYIKKEDLRFNILQRILFGLIWPLYLALLIYNLIKTIIHGTDKDQ